jgi:hypothetical protein
MERLALGTPNMPELWFAESLGVNLLVSAQDGVSSGLLGSVRESGYSYWLISEYFGLIHFGMDANHYGGFVHSERFGWMKFVPDGQLFLWVADLQTWMEVRSDGSFYSFDFREMIPTSMTTYRSPVLGNVTTGDFNGWVHSDRFGWVWAARGTNGVWFWSEDRQDWLGVTEDGGIWSTRDGRFL